MYAFADPASVSTVLSIDGRYRLSYVGKDVAGQEVYEPHVMMVPFMRRVNGMGFQLTTFYGKPYAQSFNCHILNDGVPPRFAKAPDLSMRNIVPAELRRLGYSCEVTGYDNVGWSFKIGPHLPEFERVLQNGPSPRILGA